MIRITWNNLTPPGYQSKDIVEYLLKPAIFDNPELGEKIKGSAFFEREQRGKINYFDTYLSESRTARSRLFKRQQKIDDSKSLSERMLHLLLENTTFENTPYNMNSYPIRHEFKRQWMKILTPSEELPKDLELDDNGQRTINGRRILTKFELEKYHKYICDILKIDIANDSLKKKVDGKDLLKKDLGEWLADNRTQRDFENVDVQLRYKGKKNHYIR